MESTPRTTEAILEDVGRRIKDQRIRLGHSQVELAKLANVSPRAIQNLEAGHNSTMLTFVRVLRAMGVEEDLNAIVPIPSISPMAMLRRSKRNLRVGRPRGSISNQE
ncbi:DNA-binding protein [Dyella jiangningensis]|nr:DNA-binding protein [Dyella jiangningensis]